MTERQKMDNIPPQKDVPRETSPKKDGITCVTLRSNEVIEILKTLEGIKRKLQELLKA